MTAGREVLVRCDGVARTFGEGERAVVAVHGVDCTVLAGERIAVTGPSWYSSPSAHERSMSFSQCGLTSL